MRAQGNHADSSVAAGNVHSVVQLHHMDQVCHHTQDTVKHGLRVLLMKLVWGGQELCSAWLSWLSQQEATNQAMHAQLLRQGVRVLGVLLHCMVGWGILTAVILGPRRRSGSS